MGGAARQLQHAARESSLPLVCAAHPSRSNASRLQCGCRRLSPVADRLHDSRPAQRGSARRSDSRPAAPADRADSLRSIPRYHGDVPDSEKLAAGRGCRDGAGEAKNGFASACSTMRPAYITETESQTCATTEMSCVISITVRLSSCSSLRSTSRIWCCTMTSRAVTRLIGDQ